MKLSGLRWLRRVAQSSEHSPTPSAEHTPLIGKGTDFGRGARGTEEEHDALSAAGQTPVKDKVVESKEASG
jgi:hypothetical protein